MEKFAGVLAQYGIHAVMGDDYAGQTFPQDFARYQVRYQSCPYTRHELYEKFEVTLNSRGVLLLDEPRVTEQLLGLVVRGMKIDHMPSEHDHFANSVAGVSWLASQLCYANAEDTSASNVTHCVTDYDPLTDRRPQSTDDPRPVWARPVLIID